MMSSLIRSIAFIWYQDDGAKMFFYIMQGTGLGWKPGWWLRRWGQGHDGDRKPRSKPKPVASNLKFRRLKLNPVASILKFRRLSRIQWLPRLQFGSQNWSQCLSDLISGKPKPMTLSFEAEAKHEAGAKAHHSYDAQLQKAKSQWKAKSVTCPSTWRIMCWSQCKL